MILFYLGGYRLILVIWSRACKFAIGQIVGVKVIEGKRRVVDHHHNGYAQIHLHTIETVISSDFIFIDFIAIDKKEASSHP